MSEHRRKPAQPQGGGRATGRRGQPGPASGRRAAPGGVAGSQSGFHGAEAHDGQAERPYGGRAEARRAAQRGGTRRGAAEGAGRSAGPGKPPLIDYPRRGKDGLRRWLPSWRLASGLCLSFLGVLVAAAGFAYAYVDVPKLAAAAKAENNVYYWADGSQMVATGGERNRQVVYLAQIPKDMQNAVIAQENKSFYTDSGIDPMGIARAVYNMARGGQTQGGSTITQQYVKNAMLDDSSQTISRKVTEMFVSVKLGATTDKNEILEGYLNTAYYGRGAYGIQAAAQAYFNVDAVDLDTGQCAFLAATLKGATYYDPAGATAIDPEATPEENARRALLQMQDTLDKMVEYGDLDEGERDKYRSLPETQNPRSNTALNGQIGYLVDLADAAVVKEGIATSDQLDRGGYSIHTTFEQDKVDELEKAVQKVYEEKIDPEERPETDTHVQFGGASVDPETGAIKAIYGGTDATEHFTNNADVTGAQVGSTFKPFVLAAAMTWGVRDPDLGEVQAQDERKIVSPKSLYTGQNKFQIKNYDGSVWHNEEGSPWEQVNDGDVSYGEPPDYKIDLREAMRESVNSSFVQLGMDVGLDKVKEVAVDAGILESSLAGAAFPSFSIGTSDPSAIRMAASYATFAESGKQREPYSVERVANKDGTIYEHQVETKQAFTKQVADNVTDVLTTVVEAGTGTNAQLAGREVAGKTGTTDGNRSAWFVGYTPQLSTAVSMFRLDDDESNKDREFEEMFGTGGETKIHGASFPAVIWQDYMEDALKGEPKTGFPEPEPIGEIINEEPAPSPTPEETESEEPTPSASPEPSESEVTPTPSPVESCEFLDFDCRDEDDDDGNANGGEGNGGGIGGGGLIGGNTGGGDTGGTDTGGGDSGGGDDGSLPSPPPSEPEDEPTRGNENGGLFAGRTG
ncbi:MULTISPECIES: transglycosylase domain-containing protein [unclassified Streptomyces]|uniref:transglycosylase domain-containing protein n=1 Tax=unclassified Streptomyces TaxID=2593676 RepID=UPI0019060E5F|nr:transglycosylase domain-containing protein [Streptomyces sp. HSG2]